MNEAKNVDHRWRSKREFVTKVKKELVRALRAGPNPFGHYSMWYITSDSRIKVSIEVEKT